MPTKALGSSGKYEVDLVDVNAPSTVKAGDIWPIEANYQITDTGVSWWMRVIGDFWRHRCDYTVNVLYDHNLARCVDPTNDSDSGTVEFDPGPKGSVAVLSKRTTARFKMKWDAIGVQSVNLQIVVDGRGMLSQFVPVEVTN